MNIRARFSGISARLWLLMGIAIAGAVVLAVLSLEAKRSAMFEEKRLATKHVVEVAHGVVAGYHAQIATGRLTDEQARSAAMATLKTLRYEGQEYFWINDMAPKMVMHPFKPELDGKPLGEFKDPAGKHLFVAFVDEVKQNKAGFVSYLWPKPGASEPVAKISYVQGFEPWGWVIGSGIYVDDVDAAMWAGARKMAVGFGIGISLLALLGALIARSVIRPLNEAVKAADAIADGDMKFVIDGADESETGRVLRAMRTVQDRLKAVIEAQMDMAKRHDDGLISHRIDATAFPGAYGELASRVNDLVAQHIAVKMQVVNVVAEYAKGNLAPDMEKLPGEKAAITAAIDGVKKQLLGINTEINTLVEAAAAGRFEARGNPDGYQYAFRDMVSGLNRLMETCQTGLDEVSHVLGRIAQGDLTIRMQGAYEGAFERIKNDCNATVDQLSTIVGDIRETTGAMTVAAKEIAAGNTDLSQRTEEQASSLQQTAASMEELTATVKQNADNARQANQLAESASQIAARGGNVVSQVVGTMDVINASSKKIVDIISVIDGIAFQTNILALNAAVEAARAGEQGRGFAVVATEVRNLAQRSANAAREIKALIGDSVEKVEAGSKLVTDAGATMDEVVRSVRRVTDIMGEITAASAEQSSGIEQVNQAVTQMDKVTQQNAALVEQAAAAAESMDERASGLSRTVSIFRLKDTPAAVAQASTRPRPALPAASAAKKPSRATSSAANPADETWEEF